MWCAAADCCSEQSIVDVPCRPGQVKPSHMSESQNVFVMHNGLVLDRHRQQWWHAVPTRFASVS